MSTPTTAPAQPPAPSGDPQAQAAPSTGSTPPQAPATPQTPEQQTAPQGEPQDVASLPEWAQQALATSSAAARQAAVQAAVIQAAPSAGADVARLLDSASFTAAVAQLDPSDTAAVTQAITNAVTAQPYLAAVPQTPAKGGADFTDPGPGAVTPEQFAAMSYAERADLFQTDPDTYRRLANQ